ncbi:MAG: RICIN domain-containing protein [Rhodospirillales bacterium]|nr:RICIN domain-containing protein [Rhodospirillales bacterium]
MDLKTKLVGNDMKLVALLAIKSARLHLSLLVALLVLTLAYSAPLMAQSTKNTEDIFAVLKGVPGLSNLPVRDIRKTGNSTSAQITLRNKTAKVVGFKVNGVSLAAVLPQNFKLTDIIPVPSGTPIDGISFKNVALIYVPKGQAKSNVAMSLFPSTLHPALSRSGSHITLKEGLNLFGSADFSASQAVRTVLSTIGHHQYSLPLSGAFPSNLFGHDLKTASTKLKSQLLSGLNLNLPLPSNFKIPGMPNIVSLKGAQIIVVGREIKGKPKVFAGVTGTFDVKLGNKPHPFSFGMLAAQPGAKFQAQITGDSKDKFKLPFPPSLELDDMHVVATKKSSKWDLVINAKSTLNKNPIDVAVSRDPSESNRTQFTIKTAMTLGELTTLNVPGLTDIALTEIQVAKGSFQAKSVIRKMAVDIATFKRSGKTFIAVATPKPIHISNLIPQIGKTPLDDVSFNSMTYVWAPKGTLEKNLRPQDLPPFIEPIAKNAASSFDLKAGLNVIGQMGIKKNGNLGKMLSAMGAYKSSLPLKGQLSAKAFQKGNSSQIKNEILDGLDLNIPLNVAGLYLPGNVKFKETNLEIKGKLPDGKRGLDATIRGELDAHIQNESLNLDFEVEVVKVKGQGSQVLIKGETKKGTKLTLDMVEKFELTDMSFNSRKTPKGWVTNINADTQLNNTTIKLSYLPATSRQPRHININTAGLTIGKILGVGDLPGIDNIKLESVQIYPGQWLFYADIKGIQSYITAEKVPNAKGHFVSVFLDKFSPAQLIPSAANSPLKDAEFEGLTLVYSPLKTAKALNQTGMKESAAKRIASSNGNPILKPGMNVFGHLNIHPSGELSSLLKQVGVTDLKLPLNGAISAKTLSGNVASVKNELLDSLDIKVALPKLNLPGMPGGVSIQHANVEIKGMKVKGKRALQVDVAGGLEFAHGSSKADFDFDVDLVRKSGQNKVQITAQEVKNSKLTISMVEKFELSNMSIDINNFYGGWTVQLAAESKVGSTPIDLTFGKAPGRPDSIEIDPKGLTIAKLVGAQGLPGLDDVDLTSILIFAEHNYLPAHFIVKGTVKGHPTTMQIQKGWSGGHFVAVTLGDLNLGSIIPGAANSPLKDVDFSNVAMLYSPAKSDVTLAKSGIVLNAQSWIQQSSHNPIIKPGMNVYGHMDIRPTGELAKLLKEVGVNELKLPLNGGFSPKALAKNHSAQDIKNSILDHLDIKINLPKLRIPGAGKHLTLSNEHLEIKGKLPDGKRGISVKVASDAEIKVKNEDFAFYIEVDYDRSQGAAETDLEIKGHTDKPWNKPFGISFLNLENLTLDIRKRKSADGTKTYDVDLAAKTDIGRHSKLDVNVDVHEQNGKLIDATFELEGPLKLSEIPGVSGIPEAGKFEINTIKISEHGIEAKTDFGKQKDLDAYLFTGSGWNFIMRQDHFAITEFVPPLASTPLKHIKLSEAAVVLSKDGLKGRLTDFSPIAQDALKEIYGANAVEIDVQSGLSLVAAFEHKNSGGGLSGALKRLGISEERVVLTGDIGGIFGGPIKLDVEVDLSAHAGAHNQPKWMKSKPGVEAVFSLIATEAGAGQFDIEIGIGADIIANVHGTELDFTAKTALEFEDEKIDVKVVADLKDKKGWKEPFGIPGFTLYEVGFDLGIDEDAAIHLGFDGNIKVSGETYKIAADADLLPEALGAPQDIAFVGSASKVDMFFIQEIALAMIGGNFNLDIPAGIFPEFDNVKFAFATPGAQDPDLNITGEGFALKGGMTWLEHELGQMDLSVSPKSGIFAEGAINPLNLGPLELKENHFSLKVGVKDPLPSIKVNSNIKIEYLGLHEKFDVTFNKHGASFDATADFGKDFSLHTDFKLSGVDLSAKKPEFKKADFYMEGDLKLDIGKFIAGPATTALNDVFNGLNAGFKEAESKLKGAQDKVNNLTASINQERAKVRKERAAAERRLQSAEDRVNSLNNRIDDDWHHYHHCHGWGKWACKAKWGIRIGALKGARGVADAALRLAETITAHFPIDLDPRVAVLISERDTARVALDVVLDALKGADFMDKFLKEATDEIAKEIGKSINIKKAGFAGDLKDMISKNAPLDLTLDMKMFGAEINQTLPFKIKDIPYDVEQMAMIGLHALERIVDDALHQLPGSLKHKIHNHIASQMDAKAAAAKRELAKYGKDFSKYAAQQKAMQNAMAARNSAYLQAEMAENRSPLDHDTSETITNDYIEVGHTGLCLENANGFVRQAKCADGNSSRWSTRPASGAPHTDPKGGYVFLYDTKNGHCIAPEGNWAEVKEDFSDPKLPTEGSFTFLVKEFQGDGKITVRGCVNSKEYYWKVLKHGDDWMQIANLANSQCLHFENSSALPGAAEAEWKPCVGSANQVYRLASKLTPVYHADNILLKSDQAGLCFGNANSAGNVVMVDCAKAARYDYLVDIRGYVKFVNRSSGKCLQPDGYKLGDKMTERHCTQLDYQWWIIDSQPGGFRFENAQTKQCSQPPFGTKGGIPNQKSCQNSENTVITPLTNYESGAHWAIGSASRLPNAYTTFNAAYPGQGARQICTFKYQGNNMLGTVTGNGCKIALDGQLHTSKNFTYLIKADGVRWIPNGGGYRSKYFIALANRGGANEATLYACRYKSGGETYLGWTNDGVTCLLAGNTAAPVKHFETLSHTEESFYELKLSGK